MIGLDGNSGSTTTCDHALIRERVTGRSPDGTRVAQRRARPRKIGLLLLFLAVSGVLATEALAVDEGFEGGDLLAWNWSTTLQPMSGEWSVTQRKARTGVCSVKAGRALDLLPDLPGAFTSLEPDTPRRLWIDLQVREGYLRFYAKVKRGSKLRFWIGEAMASRPRDDMVTTVWHSHNLIEMQIPAAPGWQEVAVWIPAGYWRFCWENNSRWFDSIWIDDITFAETTHSLQAERKRADESRWEGTDALEAGEYAAAIGLFSDARQSYREIQDPRGEALCLEGLASAHMMCGSPYRSVETCRQALALYRDVLDRPGMNPLLNERGTGQIHYLMAHAFDALGDCKRATEHIEQAIEHYTQAVEEGEQADDEAEEAIRELLDEVERNRVVSLRFLAQVLHTWAGDGARVREYGRLALESARESGNVVLEASCLLLQAEMSLDENAHIEALGFADDALAVAERLQERSLMARCYLMLALCNEQLQGFGAAIDYYEQALEISVAGDQRELIWEADWGLGRCCWATDRLDEAAHCYARAIAVVEEMRTAIEEEALRATFLKKLRALYEEYVRLLVESGNHGAAFPSIERCRARTFLDLVAVGPIGTLENIAEEGIRTGVVDAAAIESDLSEVIARLPSHVAALEYFVAEDATYVWLIRDGEVSDSVQLDVSRSELRERVLEFRIALETSTADMMGKPEDATLAASRDLHDLLIGPVEGELEGIEHLVVIPSGPLYYLPFCALLDCPGCEGADLLGGEYLIERFSLSYAPSLTTLKYAWASAEDTQTDSRLLALADPDAGDAGVRRLPKAQREAEAVAALFDPSEVYVDADATEDIIASRASSADQLLLSTHGTFNPLNPMFSYLQLSPTVESDGRLYTHEVFSLDLRTDLVTLSACETLLPALEEMEEDVRAVRGASPEEDVELSEELLEGLTSGDEIVGLTRAFLYAGTPSVVSSLWQVVSETTEPLMVAFYGYLQEGLGKAEALRQAQLDVMGRYRHPRYWAAFELVGDWR